MVAAFRCTFLPRAKQDGRRGEIWFVLVGTLRSRVLSLIYMGVLTQRNLSLPLILAFELVFALTSTWASDIDRVLDVEVDVSMCLDLDLDPDRQ